MSDTLPQIFITLLVVIDPVGLAPLFVGVTQHMQPVQQRRAAVRATIIASFVLMLFAWGGGPLLHALGVSLHALRIAGGLLLMLLAVEMLLGHPHGMRSAGEETSETQTQPDLAVFPLAIPLIAGPGAMTSMVLLANRAGSSTPSILALLGMLILVLVLCLFSMLGAQTMLRLIGRTGTNVISRTSGIVLAALAVQFVLDGLRAVAWLS